jgi:hypothetical protein
LPAPLDGGSLEKPEDEGKPAGRALDGVAKAGAPSKISCQALS